MYRTALPAIALLGGACAFGASGLSLALLGLGLPFLLAALLAASCAGLLLYAIGRWALARAVPAEDGPPGVAGARALLRHDLRGALQPALLVSDRLLKHDDPAIQRAGQAVVRSVERATALIVNDEATDDRPEEAAPPS